MSKTAMELEMEQSTYQLAVDIPNHSPNPRQNNTGLNRPHREFQSMAELFDAAGALIDGASLEFEGIRRGVEDLAAGIERLSISFHESMTVYTNEAMNDESASARSSIDTRPELAIESSLVQVALGEGGDLDSHSRSDLGYVYPNNTR